MVESEWDSTLGRVYIYNKSTLYHMTHMEDEASIITSRDFFFFIALLPFS